MTQKTIQTTLLQEVIAFLFGRKYYANIVGTRGTDEREICSFIFRTRQEADKHKFQLQSNRSFMYIETISFRSRHEY